MDNPLPLILKSLTPYIKYSQYSIIPYIGKSNICIIYIYTYIYRVRRFNIRGKGLSGIKQQKESAQKEMISVQRRTARNSSS